MNFIKEALDNLIKGIPVAWMPTFSKSAKMSMSIRQRRKCKNDVHSMDISPTILQEVDKVLSLQ